MGVAIFHHPPPYVAQTSQNSCWAASLDMWFKAELGYTKWTQLQLRNSAEAFTVSPSGINLMGLQHIIDDSTKVGTIQMRTKVVNSASEVPKIPLILTEVGYVYIAFQHPDGRGGHVNVLSGWDGDSTFAATDPDPGVRNTDRTNQFYFTRFPAFVAWRQTSSMIGLDYTGRAPWDYE
jgi:Papain-like cysteine protease AvrRpt2